MCKLRADKISFAETPFRVGQALVKGLILLASLLPSIGSLRAQNASSEFVYTQHPPGSKHNLNVAGTDASQFRPLHAPSDRSLIDREVWQSRDRSTSTLKGHVYDSLTQKFSVGAAVWIQKAGRTTITDSAGKFEFQDLENGSYDVEWVTPVTDSAGLLSQSRRVNVTTPSVDISLASPSFTTLWRKLCGAGSAPTSNQGILWGTIRDADSDIRLSGARTYVRWYDTESQTSKRFSLEERGSEFTSDSTGTFYGCGVPTDVSVRTQSVGARSASGEVAIVLGVSRIRRIDIWVSHQLATEMQLSAATDSAGITTRVGTSKIRGIVRDSSGAPLANAIVSVEASNRAVRSDTLGNFVLDSLPSGTQELEIRQVGYAPLTRVMRLQGGSTEIVELSMQRANRLNTVNVRASMSSTRDRDDYEARRRAGFGFAIDSTTLQRSSSLATALRMLPSVQVGVENGVTRIKPTTPKSLIQIPPLCQEDRAFVWLDGRRSSLSIVSTEQMASFVAVEWFARGTTAPEQFKALGDCPVILFWTSRSRW